MKKSQKNTSLRVEGTEQSIALPLKVGFLFLAKLRAQELKDKKEQREYYKIIAYLEQHLEEIRLNGKHPGEPGAVVYTVRAKEEQVEEVVEKVGEYLNYGYAPFFIAEATGTLEAFVRWIEKEPSKPGKFKRSGHLTDQLLKYNYPKDRKRQQLSIFDNLQEQTKKDIEVAGVEVSQIVEGIKLSPSETKVIDCLTKLLHETSQTSDAKKEDYYSGNIGYELVDYGGDKNTPAPKLAFTLYELAREYKGGEYVSGKDIENLQKILTELDSKRFLIKYTETTKGKKGEWIKKEYETFRRLIGIDKATLSYGVGDVEHYKKTQTVIVLNPIFRRQIDSKFILYPNDINRRTIIAYGSHNVSQSTLTLREYLAKEHALKHYSTEIGLERLYYLLAEKWMEEGRKKKVKEYTEKALETVKALGLLLSYEIKTNSTGEPKVVFTLNKEWE
jgi:hypothetical protein